MTLLSSALLSGGSIIDLDGTIFVQFGLFVFAYILLRALVFRPMVALFEVREQRIDGAKDEAVKLQKEAKLAGRTFDQEMQHVRLQATEERERLRQEGSRLERGMLDTVREETQKKMAHAETKLEQEAVRLRSELTTTIPVLANQIASKLLEREVR